MSNRTALLIVQLLMFVVTASQTDGPAPAAMMAPGRAGISGRVLAGGTGETPIAHAVVTIQAAALSRERFVTTDAAGGFSFSDLPSGRYVVSATKPGLVPAFYGSKRPGRGPGASVALTDGQQITDISLRMLLGAAIGGRATDQLGRPKADVQVQLLEVQMVAGMRLLTRVATLITDDVGMYRFFGLRPGQYVVSAFPRQTYINGASAPTDADFVLAERGQTGPSDSPAILRKPIGYTATLYSDAVNADQATTIPLAAAEERTDIDVQFRVFPTALVTGHAVDAQGRVPPALQLAITNNAKAMGFQQRVIAEGVFGTTRLSATAGRFSTAPLTPGHYTVLARAAEDAAMPSLLTQWAIVDVDVNGQDVQDLVVALQPGMTMSGRIERDRSESGTLDPTSVKVQLMPLSNSGVSLAVAPCFGNADGSFTLRGIAPGRYRVAVSAGASGTSSPAWTPRSAVLGGKDILDSWIEIREREDVTGIVVTLSDRSAGISGVLVDAHQLPAPEYLVVVFPADRDLWTPQSRRVRQVHPSTDGHFAVVTLPAGEYLIAAVTDLDPADLDDPAFLTLLAGSALKTRVLEGQITTQSLRMAGGM